MATSAGKQLAREGSEERVKSREAVGEEVSEKERNGERERETERITGTACGQR